MFLQFEFGLGDDSDCAGHGFFLFRLLLLMSGMFIIEIIHHNYSKAVKFLSKHWPFYLKRQNISYFCENLAVREILLIVYCAWQPVVNVFLSQLGRSYLKSLKENLKIPSKNFNPPF